MSQNHLDHLKDPLRPTMPGQIAMAALFGGAAYGMERHEGMTIRRPRPQGPNSPGPTKRKHDKAKAKRRRKMAKRSRARNRR